MSKFLGVLFLLPLILVSIGSGLEIIDAGLSGSYELTVETDKDAYELSEVVKISGQYLIDGSAYSGQDIAIQINGPDSNVVFVDQVTTNFAGRFSSTLTIPDEIPSGTFISHGVYTLHAAASGTGAYANFTFIDPPQPEPVDFPAL